MTLDADELKQVDEKAKEAAKNAVETVGGTALPLDSRPRCALTHRGLFFCS